MLKMLINYRIVLINLEGQRKSFTFADGLINFSSFYPASEVCENSKRLFSKEFFDRINI